MALGEGGRERGPIARGSCPEAAVAAQRTLLADQKSRSAADVGARDFHFRRSHFHPSQNIPTYWRAASAKKFKSTEWK